MNSRVRFTAAALFFVLGSASAKPTDTTALDYGEACTPTEAMSERMQPLRLFPEPVPAPKQRQVQQRSRLSR